MQTIFQGDWYNMSVEEYITNTRNRTGIIWIGRLYATPMNDLMGIFNVTNTRTRACHITSPHQWDAFISSCYSLECENAGENWMSINGRKILFRDYMSRVAADPSFFAYNESKFEDRIFCTVYDTQKRSRLIVDGSHRANALTLECDKGLKNMPSVTINECYGDRVDVIFPCDIRQLPGHERG